MVLAIFVPFIDEDRPNPGLSVLNQATYDAHANIGVRLNFVKPLLVHLHTNAPSNELSNECSEDVRGWLRKIDHQTVSSRGGYRS
jgi:hypothetical protein